ncbi:hypothetical protein NL676_025319 [Syzygium grande]|nr:hypothetical protein NL676_025319 [Syzygium grande]
MPSILTFTRPLESPFLSPKRPPSHRHHAAGKIAAAPPFHRHPRGPHERETSSGGEQATIRRTDGRTDAVQRSP